jgi:hypothetical protein
LYVSASNIVPPPHAPPIDEALREDMTNLSSEAIDAPLVSPGLNSYYVEKQTRRSTQPKLPFQTQTPRTEDRPNLVYTLAICYLACYWLRCPILMNDIVQ